MKEIPLTQGYAALVDDEDFEELSKHKWCVSLMRAGPKARRAAPRDKGGKQGTILMHRQIMNAPFGMPVDHWDHDTLNNRKENLRVCTYSQNGANQRKTRGSSRFKGVTWNKSRGKWQAQIEVAGHHKYLGLFLEEEKAAQAYNDEAAKRFLDFALLNEILSINIGGVQA